MIGKLRNDERVNMVLQQALKECKLDTYEEKMNIYEILPKLINSENLEYQLNLLEPWFQNQLLHPARESTRSALEYLLFVVRAIRYFAF